MQLEVISHAIQAFFNNEIENENPAGSYRTIAIDIRREFEKKYKGPWHCIVGMIILTKVIILEALSLMKINISFILKSISYLFFCLNLLK